jgi:hypothetical protein
MTSPRRLLVVLSLSLAAGGLGWLVWGAGDDGRRSAGPTQTSEEPPEPEEPAITNLAPPAKLAAVGRNVARKSPVEGAPHPKSARAPFATQRLPAVRSVDASPHSSTPEIERGLREREDRARPLNRRLEKKLEQLVTERERAVGAERARLDRRIEILSRLFESRRRVERDDRPSRG